MTARRRAKSKAPQQGAGQSPGQVQEFGGSNSDGRSMSRARLIYFLTAALLASVIVISGSYYYSAIERQFLIEAKSQLKIIVDLKTSDVGRWRRERLGDGETLAGNPAFSALARSALEGPGAAEAQRRLLSWLSKYQAQFQYDEVRFVDVQGVTRVSLPPGLPAVSTAEAEGVREVLRSRRVTFQDFYRDEPDKLVRLGVLVPIFDEQDAGRPFGVLFLRIDPGSYLFPLLGRWPLPSRTAETLLVRREGDEVVFLNNVRFRPESSLELRAPLTDKRLPAVMAVMGQEGVVEGIDYRGASVVAVLRAIPDSPWFMVARVDKAETFEPLRDRQLQLIGLIALLLLSAFAGLASAWHRQRAGFSRLQAEAAAMLTASELRYRRLFEAARDGVLILDAGTGLVVDVNPYMIELLGVTRDVFLGKRVWELGFFKDLIANETNFRELQQKGYVRYEDLALEGHDGKRHEVEFISNVYLVNAQKVIQCNIRDISDRVLAATEIRRLSEELEQRVRDRTKDLEATNKELEAFSYSVSHDLRAPLRHVQGYVAMLARDAESQLSDRGRHFMKTIEDASREMGLLIDDLLAFSRMGRAEMAEAPASLDTLVQDTLRGLEETTRTRNIVWNIHPLPIVRADSAMLRLVLSNLLGNAVKFTRPRDPAQIEVGSAGTENGRVVLFVRDNGVGFDPQYVEKLFGVFQRLHRAEEFEGTGIGLGQRAAHHRPARRAHVGRGPVGQGRDCLLHAGTGGANTPGKLKGRTTMGTEVKSILLVEDSLRDVELTLDALAQSNLANEVIVLRDGAEALDYLYRRGQYADRPSGNPAVVLMDLKMPRLSGVDVLRQIKGDPKLRTIPMVILTSSREQQDLVISYELGVNAYIVKPVQFADFVAAVKLLGSFWAVVNEPPPGSVRPYCAKLP